MKKIKSRLVYLNESPGGGHYHYADINNYSSINSNNINNNHFYSKKDNDNYNHNFNNSFSYSAYMSHQALPSLQKVRTVIREKSPSPDYKNRSRIPHTQSPSKQVQDYFTIQAKKKARAIKMNKMSSSLLIPSQGSSQSSKSLFESLYKDTNLSFGGSVIDFKMNRTMSNKNSIDQDKNNNNFNNKNNNLQMVQSKYEQNQSKIQQKQWRQQQKNKEYIKIQKQKQRLNKNKDQSQLYQFQTKKKLVIKQKDMHRQTQKQRQRQKQKRMLKIKTQFEQNFDKQQNKKKNLQKNNQKNNNSSITSKTDNIYFPGHKNYNSQNKMNNTKTVTTNPSPTSAKFQTLYYTNDKYNNKGNNHNTNNSNIKNNNNNNKNFDSLNFSYDDIITANMINNDHKNYKNSYDGSVYSLKQNKGEFQSYHEHQLNPYHQGYETYIDSRQKTCSNNNLYIKTDQEDDSHDYQFQNGRYNQYQQINRKIRLQQPQSVKNTNDSQKLNQYKLFKSFHNNSTPKNSYVYDYPSKYTKDQLQNTIKTVKVNKNKDQPKNQHQNQVNDYQAQLHKNSIRINRSQQKQKPNLFKKQKKPDNENQIKGDCKSSNYLKLKNNKNSQKQHFSYYTPKRGNQDQYKYQYQHSMFDKNQVQQQVQQQQKQLENNRLIKQVKVKKSSNNSNKVIIDIRENINENDKFKSQNETLKIQNEVLKRSIINYQQLMEKHHQLMKKHQKMETEMEYLIQQLESSKGNTIYNTNNNNDKNNDKIQNKNGYSSDDYIRISQNLQEDQEQQQQSQSLNQNLTQEEYDQKQEQLSEPQIQRENKHLNVYQSQNGKIIEINNNNNNHSLKKRQNAYQNNDSQIQIITQKKKANVNVNVKLQTTSPERKRFSVGYKIRRGIDKHGNINQTTMNYQKNDNNNQIQKHDKTQQTLLTEQEGSETNLNYNEKNRSKINKSHSFQIHNENNHNLQDISSLSSNMKEHNYRQLEQEQQSYKMLLEMNKKLADSLGVQTQDNHLLILQNQKLVDQRTHLQKQITNWMDKIIQIKQELSKVDKLSNQFSQFKASINNSVKQNLRNTQKRLEQLRRQLKMNLIDKHQNTYTFSKKESMPTFGKLSSGEQQMIQNDIKQAPFSENNSLETSFQISHSSRSAENQHKQNQKLLQQMRKKSQEQKYVYIAPQNEQILISQSSGKYAFGQQKQKQRWLQQQNSNYKQFDKSSKADSIPRQRQQSFVNIKCSGLDQNFFYQHKYDHLIKQRNNEQTYVNYLGSKQNSQNSQNSKNSDIKINMQSSGQTQELREATRLQKHENDKNIKQSSKSSIVNINMNATVSNISLSQKQSIQQQNSLDKVQKEYIAQLESEAQQMRSLITSITLQRDHLKKSMKGKIETIDELQRSLKQINLTLEEAHQKPASTLRQEKTFKFPSEQSLKHTKSQTSMRDQFLINQNNQQQQMLIQIQDQTQADRQYRKTREIVLNLIRIVRQMIDQYGDLPKQTAKFSQVNY